MIIVHTHNGDIETSGHHFEFGDKYVKVYTTDSYLIGVYLWQNIIGVTDTKEDMRND